MKKTINTTRILNLLLLLFCVCVIGSQTTAGAAETTVTFYISDETGANHFDTLEDALDAVENDVTPGAVYEILLMKDYLDDTQLSWNFPAKNMTIKSETGSGKKSLTFRNTAKIHLNGDLTLDNIIIQSIVVSGQQGTIVGGSSTLYAGGHKFVLESGVEGTPDAPSVVNPNHIFAMICGGGYSSNPIMSDTEIIIKGKGYIDNVVGGGNGDIGTEKNPHSTSVTVSGPNIRIRTVNGGSYGTVWGNTSVLINDGATVEFEVNGGTIYSGMVKGDSLLDISGAKVEGKISGSGGSEEIVSNNTKVIVRDASVIGTNDEDYSLVVLGASKSIAGNTEIIITGGSTIYGGITGGSGSGEVSGSTSITVDGNSSVTGNLHGGCASNNNTSNTEITIDGASVTGDIYAGGNRGSVEGNAAVILINGAFVSGKVYGGGEDQSAAVMGTTYILCDSSARLGAASILKGSAVNACFYYVGGSSPETRKSILNHEFTGSIKMLDEIILGTANEIYDDDGETILDYDVVVALPYLTSVGSISSTASGAADIPGRSYIVEKSAMPPSVSLSVTGAYFGLNLGRGEKLIPLADFSTASIPLTGGLLSGSVSVSRADTPLEDGDLLSVGDTLSSDTTELNVLPSTELYYQWYRNDVPIDGATSSSYTVSKLDASLGAKLKLVVSAKGYIGQASSKSYTVEYSSVPLVVDTWVVDMDLGDTRGWNSITNTGWRYVIEDTDYSFLTLVNYKAQKNIVGTVDLLIAAGGFNHIGKLDVSGEVTFVGKGIVLIDSIGTETTVSPYGPAVFLRDSNGRYVMQGTIGITDGVVTLKDGLSYVVSENAELIVESRYYKHCLTVPGNAELIVKSGGCVRLALFDPAFDDDYSENITRIEIGGMLIVEDGGIVDSSAGKFTLKDGGGISCLGSGHIKGNLDISNGAVLPRLFLKGTATISSAKAACQIGELVTAPGTSLTLRFAESATPQECDIGSLGVYDLGESVSASTYFNFIGSYYFPKQDGFDKMGEWNRVLDLPDFIRIDSGIDIPNCELAFTMLNTTVSGSVDVDSFDVNKGSLFIDANSSPAFSVKSLSLSDAYFFSSGGEAVISESLSPVYSKLYAAGGLSAPAGFSVPDYSLVFAALADVQSPAALYIWEEDESARRLLPLLPATYSGAATYSALSAVHSTTTYPGQQQYTLTDTERFTSIGTAIDMNYFFQHFIVTGLDSNGKFVCALINSETATYDFGGSISTILSVDTMYKFLIPQDYYKMPADVGTPGDEKSTSSLSTSSAVLGGQSTSALCSVGVHQYVADGGSEATCTSAGLSKRTCSSCGTSFSQKNSAPLGHNYVNSICSRCGAQNVCNHQYGASTVITAATCTAKGQSQSTCTLCGNVSVEVTPALGHSYSGTKCSRCGAFSGGGFGGTETVSKPDSGASTEANGLEMQLSADVNGIISPDTAAVEALIKQLESLDPRPSQLSIVIDGLKTPYAELRLPPTLIAVLQEYRLSLLIQIEDCSLYMPISVFAASDDALTVIIDRQPQLTEAQRALVGDRPFIRIRVLKDGVAQNMSQHKLRLNLPYKLRSGESSEGLILCHVTADGDATRLGGFYQNGLFEADLPHLSVFFLAYDASLVWNNPFTDVLPDQWHYDSVRFVYQKGLFKGMSENSFGPDLHMTRAMFVTVLWHYAGDPVSQTTAQFADVSSADWYFEAVSWASELGVVEGFDDGSFRADQKITREQLVTMLYRYLERPKTAEGGKASDAQGFNDAALISDYALEAVNWACSSGLLNGYDDGTLRSGGLASRAETAAILHRFLQST